MGTKDGTKNEQKLRIDEDHGALPLLQNIVETDEEEQQKAIAQITEDIFKQFATKDQLNLQHVMLTIQNDKNLMKKYSAAYICLRQYMKAGLNQGHHQLKTQTKQDIMNLLKGYQIPQKALSFFSDSQFATVSYDYRVLSVIHQFYEILDLQKEGTLDQADFERAFQLMKNMKLSKLQHGLDADQDTNLMNEEVREIALFLQTLDQYSMEGDIDRIISPEQFYAALTFEQPINMQESIVKSRFKGMTRRPQDQQ